MRFLPGLAFLAILPGLPAAQCPVSKVTAADSAVLDRFGWALDLAGDTLFVGAPLDNIVGRNTGSVHVFERDGLNWFLKTKLVAPDAHQGQVFGTKLASDGRHLAVCASRMEFAASHGPGVLYVYEERGRGFELVARLGPIGATPRPEDLFGIDLALEGDWLFAGAPHDSESSPDLGAVHVFHRTGGVWVPHGKLTPTVPERGTLFGSSIALDGERLVVGAPWNSSRAPNGGAAHVFERVGSEWIERERLFPAESRTEAIFGSGVALDGTTIACGAEYDDQRGAVHVLEFDKGAWVESTKLAPSFLDRPGLLGRELAFAGGRLLATAIGHGANGVVLQFARSGSSWALEEVIEPEDAPAIPGLDFFGWDLAASGDLVAIGAPWNDQRSSDAGAVYVRCATNRLCATLSSPRETSWGKQRLEIDRGAANAGHFYWLAGSMSGTSPGIRFRGLRIPLNVDTYFRSLIAAPNQGWVTNNLGLLDASGRATVELRVPPESYAALVGLTFHHAFAELGPSGLEHVSNAVPLFFGARH
ncbi:MAG: hypothetical protein ABL998_08880 [Planctomycetota bacterium]